MIRLELTHQEADLLHHLLTDTSPGQLSAVAATVLVKLQTAQEQATRMTRCPVCETIFPQTSAGRIGEYCSAACKQKAYRLRRNAQRRQFGPAA